MESVFPAYTEFNSANKSVHGLEQLRHKESII